MNAVIENLSAGLKFVISWIVLTTMAIIVSGKLLADMMQLTSQRRQLFQIKLPYILHLSAHNDEVVLGLGLFLADFGISAFIAGPQIYQLTRSSLGIDLGQLNSISVFSAFTAIVISIILWVVYRGRASLRAKNDSVLKEYDRIISDLARKEGET